MLALLMWFLLMIGTLAGLIWRAKRCSSYGCGVQEWKS